MKRERTTKSDACAYARLEKLQISQISDFHLIRYQCLILSLNIRIPAQLHAISDSKQSISRRKPPLQYICSFGCQFPHILLYRCIESCGLELEHDQFGPTP